MNELHIQTATRSDSAAWARLRAALWPEDGEAEHLKEVEGFFQGEWPFEEAATLLARDAAGRAVGFVEVSTRPYAEGCRSRRVAYLEGWYVAPEVRKQGIGKALVDAAENWGRSIGCSEFASDADPANEISRAAHGAVGFEDVGLVRCFRKAL